MPSAYGKAFEIRRRKRNRSFGYLYAYLICERNISAASDYLYIHRNTMTYRLKKIDSLVNINYDDPKERQYLILSYEMHKINKG
ncbi:MAG: helix-turn-helix domain-containing protein [Lachnospiraceae bacterium]|nr:helix-turn-helix domain-containing protein [Lachnospiraceae bacterium]